MKTLLHNFSGVFRRFRLPTALNLIGMSVAFAVFLILMMQMTYEWGFDRFHKLADCLYRLEITHEDYGGQACLNRPLIDAFVASSPHIVKGALLNGFVDKQYVMVEHDGNRESFLETLYPVSADYADVFELTMVEGDRSALSVPGQALISHDSFHSSLKPYTALSARLHTHLYAGLKAHVSSSCPSSE